MTNETEKDKKQEAASGTGGKESVRTVYVPQPVYVQAPAPAQNPYSTADYEKSVREDYATSLADIRRQRRAMQERYRPDIEKQQRMMKINALGKLLGAVGQLAGGGRGPVIKDPDPYQITAWNRLQQMKNEQKAYDRYFDTQEMAAAKGMRDSLSRLNAEKYKAAARQGELTQKYALEMQKLAANAQIKGMLAEADRQFKREMQASKTADQLKVAERRHELAVEEILKRAGVQKGLIGDRLQSAKDLWDYKGEHPHPSATDAFLAAYLAGHADGSGGGVGGNNDYHE